MGKSAQTVGYWYKLALHFGWCQGPIDALLEIRGGDKPAWQGRQEESGTITIDALNLYGGEKQEGGIQGDFDVMMGEADQMPNAYLAAIFGPEQSGHRGKAGGVFKGGKIGAINPYPKPLSFKLERILKGWDNDTCWYPDKAVIELQSDYLLPADASVWEYQTIAYHTTPGYSNLTAPTSGWTAAQAPFAGGDVYADGNTNWPTHTILWARCSVDIPAGGARTLRVVAENGCVVFVNGALVGAVNRDNVQIVGNQANTFTFNLAGGASYAIVVKAFDETDPGGGTFLSVEVLAPGLKGMNPAHMLYDSITSRPESGGQGEPTALINSASFTAAADTLFGESFGLCTSWEGDETAEDFQQRILDIIGGCLSQSRVDGQYYLDLIRPSYDIDLLPIISETDVIEFSAEPTNISEAINQVIVEWFDPQAKESRATAPTISLGAVQAAGGVIAQTITHREVPVEGLALRIAARELQGQATPLMRFNLTSNRRPYQLRPGRFFRLQMPSEGIADMVCLAGDVDYGQLTDGRMKIVAVQDVFGMPSSVYVDPTPGLDGGSDPSPYPSANQVVVEAPYVELAARLSTADLAALSDESGALATIATRPSGSGINYSVYSAADGEGYVDRGTADWCPTALVVEAAAPGDTAFTLTGALDLDEVSVGDGALWGDEIVKVVAIDASALTLTLGRGCADTVPAPSHAAGERIYFYGDRLGTDGREYIDGELVHAKLLTRTSSAEQDLSLAPDNPVTMDQRAARPYAPGQFTINGAAYPTMVDGTDPVAVAWVHRDRLLQKNQLVDTAAAGIGPEALTTYNVRYFLDGTEVGSQSAIVGTAATPYNYASGGTGRIELEAERDSLVSWQMHAHEFTVSAPIVANYVALPMTYDEVDYAGTMTWVRQANGPVVTPMGFEGDGYGCRLKSTTIPSWMATAAAKLTMHASVSFYPQQLKSTSEFAVYAGTDASSPAAKLIILTSDDATNSSIPQLLVQGTTSGGVISKRTARSNWAFRFRAPELSSGSFAARPQAILFLDSDTVLLSVHFEETFSRVYKIRLSDNTVLAQFDCSGDFVHLGTFARRSNGDLWALAASNKACRIDLTASFSAGSLVTLDVMAFSGITCGGLDFVTISGTEYAVLPEYLVSGSPYIYVLLASSFGTTTITAASRYKRFTGCPIEVQGCAMRSAKLYTSSTAKPGAGTGSRFGYIGRYDIVTAIGSTADNSAITVESTWDAPSKYTEDCAVHPTTNDLWAAMEGITVVGSDAGGLSVWSSPLDGSLVENHYTCEYNGAGLTTIKINNRLYDTLSGTLSIGVACVTVGGPPATAAGMTARYFTGYVRNLVLQDQVLSDAQYAAAVSGSYEPNSLTAYTFTLTNPGAESGSTTGWTNETGAMAAITYPTVAVPPHGGTHFFSGGTVASTIARQRLDILAQTGLTGTQVDAGGIWAKVRWWQASFDSATDPAGLGLRTLTSGAVSQGEAYSGIAFTPNSNGSSYYPWYPRCFSQSLPFAARSLDVLAKFTRTGGTNNDGWVDDITVTVYRQ